MLKYVETKVVMAEIPDEITLAINISNCPCHCEGCHSSYLAEDVGKELNAPSLEELISNNKGITCVSFMGGDSEPSSINALANWVKTHYSIKVAWYSGRESLSGAISLKNFDYIKLGPYKEECGPLNNKTTNQKFYSVVKKFDKTASNFDYTLEDITYKFWKGV